MINLGHQIIIMSGSRVHHISRLLLCHSLILLCPPLLFLEPLEPILHNLVFVLSLLHLQMIVKHHNSVLVHTALASKRWQRDCAKLCLLAEVHSIDKL